MHTSALRKSQRNSTWTKWGEKSKKVSSFFPSRRVLVSAFLKSQLTKELAEGTWRKIAVERQTGQAKPSLLPPTASPRRERPRASGTSSLRSEGSSRRRGSRAEASRQPGRLCVISQSHLRMELPQFSSLWNRRESISPFLSKPRLGFFQERDKKTQ